MKLKLFLSILAVSLMTLSASDHEQEADLNDGPTAAVVKRNSARSPKGSPTKSDGQALPAKKGGMLGSVFTVANAKSGLTTVVKTAAVVGGTSITADACALATTGAAYGCSTFFGTNLATLAATSLTLLPMVTLPTAAVIVGGVVLLPTAAVAMNTINGLLPAKFQFKKTEKFLTGWTAWGANTLLMAGTIGYMNYQQASAKVVGSAPKGGNPTPGILGQPGK